MSLVEVDCPSCFITFAIPRALYNRAQEEKDRRSIYCPNGHGWHYCGEREADIERRKRQQAEQEIARMAEVARKAGIAQRVAESMLRKHKTRAKAGLCPCCNRSFVNMQRHMKTKHPNYNAMSELEKKLEPLLK